MHLCLLASGSKGNALYLEAGDTRLLFDAGLSLREVTARLATLGVAADSIDALVVSHEHVDHCRGVGPFARRYGVPVFVPGAEAFAPLGRVPDLRCFDPGESFDCKGLRIETFPVTHDAACCVGFTAETKAGKLGIATDLGIATRLVRQRLLGCRALVLEFNHDEGLLRDGPYPWHLKQRIRSNHGHLSNTASAELLRDLTWNGLEAVFLAHLSEANNTPQLALAAAQTVLDGQNHCAPQVIIGRQDRASAGLRFSA